MKAILVPVGVLQAPAPPVEPHVARAINDLICWKESGLPAAACWNCEGFSPAWHVAQVKAGHRLIPSVFFPNYDAFDAVGGTSCLRPRQIELHVTRYAADLAWLQSHNVPLCIRTNNIADGITLSPRYRGGDFAEKPLVYRHLPDGTLDQSRIADPLAPGDGWEEEAKLWGSSPWVQEIGRLYPRPPWVMFVENNEGSYDSVLRSYKDAGVTRRCYVDSATGKWLPDIEKHSVRLAAWIAKNPSVEVATVESWFWQQRGRHHTLLFDYFKGTGPEGWRGVPWYTAAYGGSMSLLGPKTPPGFLVYGYDGEGLAYDALSGGQYITGQNGDLTSLHYWSQASNLIPAWEWTEARNGNAWREVSVSINAGGAISGANAGRHEIATPDVFDAWCGFLLWSLRERGVPMLLRHWIGSSTKPTDAFSSNPPLSEFRQGDYVAAMMRAVDRICEHPTLREFWLKGQPVINKTALPRHPTDLYRAKFAPGTRYPREGDADNRWRVLDCDVNTPRSEWKWGYKNVAGKDVNEINGFNKAWCVATELKGEFLICGFTPMKLGVVKLTIPGRGDVSFDFGGQHGVYRLYAPPQTGLVEVPL